MKLTHQIRFSLAIGFLCGLTSAAYAQNALGNGRALDNNLQQGTGRYNAAQAAPNYSQGNDLVTGNVTGLGYWHGTVGYRNPGELGTSTTTADQDFFRFQAISFPTTPGAAPYVNPGAGMPVYHSESPTLAGQLNQLSPTNPVLLPREAAPGPWSASSFGDPWSTLTTPIVPTLGSVMSADGKLLQVNASPLLGLRYDNTGTPYLPAPGVDPLAPEARATTPAGPQQDNLATLLGLASDMTIVPSIVESVPYSERTPANPLDSRLLAERPDDPSQSLERRIARLEASLQDPMAPTNVPPGQDAYADLLRRIQERHDLIAGVTPKPSPFGTPAAPGTAGAPGAAALTSGNGLPAANPAAAAAQPGQGSTEAPAADATAATTPVPALPAPTSQQMRDAAEARDRAVRAARGLPVQPAEPATPNDSAKTNTSHATPGQKSGALDEDSPLPPQLSTFADALKRDLPPLATLSGARANRTNELLRKAEADMVAGRYFAAEAKYRAVLEYVPDQPMASIGHVHAEMGAGMTRSAGIDLRAVFERHPELIATRYDARLLPRADRLTRARTQLDDMTRTTNRPEPAIALAYLGYQTHNADLVRYGLDLAQASAPKDVLVRLLRRVWLDHKATGPTTRPADAAAPAPAPASTGGSLTK